MKNNLFNSLGLGPLVDAKMRYNYQWSQLPKPEGEPIPGVNKVGINLFLFENLSFNGLGGIV